MRQRKLKDLEELLEKYKRYMVDESKECKGKWKEKGKDQLFLEIGCGKGQFLTKLAGINPKNQYIGIEGQLSVIVKAGQKIHDNNLANMELVPEFVEDLTEYFEERELDGIYLNFSDPWPKKKHGKRRLTHRKKLQTYGRIVKKGGFIAFKTDSQDFFEFTLEEIAAIHMNIEEISRDLHGSLLKAKEVTTEYEEKFPSRGMKINYVKIKV